MFYFLLRMMHSCTNIPSKGQEIGLNFVFMCLGVIGASPGASSQENSIIYCNWCHRPDSVTNPIMRPMSRLH